VPDPQSIATFERSRLNWDERTREPHAGFLDWHRQLIRLRNATPDLTDGRMDRVRTRFNEQAGWLVIKRGSVIIAVNLGLHPQRLPLGEAARREVSLASSTQVTLHADTIELSGNSVAILKS
jgi:maltooligosyltrehalose trehalohydrolase